MTNPHLESFLESLDTLPADLQRNFTLMRDLDMRAQDLINAIRIISENYVDKANELDEDEKCDKFSDIRNKFAKATSLSDDKIQLSAQTYEMIDKYIRRLDSELTKLEDELKEKILFQSTTPKEGRKRGRGKGTKGKGKASSVRRKNVYGTDKGHKKQRVGTDPSIALAAIPGSETSILATITGSADVLDMPVDPNEPTYCICHQVSFGEMIGCDNPDCPIEWFHFACVGLTTKPKGKWYCSKCSNDRKKK
ncbi:inhibitor of growth protein 5 [Tetranychus urticae]|uniref:Inhibitor of growth protein n=1 Tax=Tetranychus urticae TaxID=32264 RepID=T1KYP8_TETUR|nr:inhibitor of growth protein 5 [Tetranychus urticae]